MVRKNLEEPAVVELIRQAIRDSGLTLVELGQAAAVNPAQLYRFMNDERTLTLPVAARVLDVLGFDLVRRRAPPPPSPRRPRGRPRKEQPEQSPPAEPPATEAPPAKRMKEQGKPRGK